MNASPPPYVMVGNQRNQGNDNMRLPPYRTNVSRYHSDYNQHKRSKGAKCCLWFLCCICCWIFLQVIILAALALYFYTFYKPQLPNYNVHSISVKYLDLQPDFHLNSEILVTVKADNPNSKVGFVYGPDGSAAVLYTGSKLCSGKMPHFEQGGKSTTTITVDMKGNAPFGIDLQHSLQENIKKAKIPVLVKLKAPVDIVIWKIPMRKIQLNINCSLILDNFAPNKKIGIISSKYHYGL